MKTRVTIQIIDSPLFGAGRDYSAIGVSADVSEGRLRRLETVIEHDVSSGHEEIVYDARQRLAPILNLIEFGRGCPLRTGTVLTQAVEPASSVAVGLATHHADALIVRDIPLPPAESICDELTMRQVSLYNAANRSDSPVERVRGFFQVLELEEFASAKSGAPYKAPDDMRRLRHALSHPKLDDPKVVAFVQSTFGASHIDVHDDKHLALLRKGAETLRREAAQVLEKRIPKWW